MLKDSAKEQAVAFAKGRIEELDAEIARLAAERRTMVQFVATTTGEPIDEIGHALEVSTTAPQNAAVPTSEESKAYHSRQFNQRVVDEAVQMIEENGEPMSAPELHRRHSKRDIVPTEVLYRLLYNRVISGSLMSLNGAFWLEGKNPPPGDWDLSTAKRSKKFTEAAAD